MKFRDYMPGENFILSGFYQNSKRHILRFVIKAFLILQFLVLPDESVLF